MPTLPKSKGQSTFDAGVNYGGSIKLVPVAEDETKCATAILAVLMRHQNSFLEAISYGNRSRVIRSHRCKIGGFFTGP